MPSDIGRIDEFDENKEKWDSYVERLEQYFLANEVTDDKQVPILLTVVGSSTYGLMKSILAPDLPSTKSYDELVEALKNHFSPTPVVIAERFKFHQRNQKEGENVSNYLVVLKQLATTCDFGEFLSQALRDRLVCGLRDAAIQRKLLAVANLELKNAVEIAVAMELAVKNSLELKPNNQDFNSCSKPVNKVVHHRKSTTNYQYRNPHGGNKYNSYNNSPNSKGPPKGHTVSRCFRCGNHHQPNKCSFRTSECFVCSQRGHIAKMCPTKRNKGYDTHYLTEDEDDRFGLYSVYHANGDKSPYLVEMSVNAVPTILEVDTGAALTIFPESVVSEKFGNISLYKSEVLMKTYSGEQLPVLGQFDAIVKYNNQQATLPIIVVKGDNPILLGRNWLEKVKLDWSNVFRVEAIKNDPEVQQYVKKYPAVFRDGVGTIKGFKANILLQKDAKPLFFKHRTVPYALTGLVEKELDRLESNGVISKVAYSKWATPIVIVPKSDNSIRICGDYKVTVNKCIEVQQYPLPNAEDIFATLAGGTLFTKLDLSSAYQQLEIDPQSEELLTINTHKGLFKCHRLAFGVSSAPAIFQSVLEQILQGMKGVMCRLDDILISAPTRAEHLKRVDLVLQRLQKHGVRLKLSKCVFMKPSVNYLGYKVDKDGIHPLQDKVEAIEKAKSPNNVSELKSFLGLINYYGKFLPNLSTLLHPLHELLQKDVTWNWTDACEEAFVACKKKLLNSRFLTHYDVRKPLKLACDASSYGVGSVISHIEPDGQEKPIAFASRTLSSSEKNYSQLEKEALSIIFGVKKFHQYLYGRSFILETDHKPLTTILGPHVAVPTLAAARLQRWALILSAYNYEIVYRRSEDHCNADAMSRCLVNQSEPGTSEEADIYYFTYLNELPVNSQKIAESTRNDPVLSLVFQYTLNGWPNTVNQLNLEPYFKRKDELSTDQGCLLWGMRVIIPVKFRERLLNDLHEVHPGMSRMKSLARSYIWWPSIDQDIEDKVRSCGICLALRKSPPASPLIPWKWPKRVWQRLHIDFAEFQRQHFLIVIDSFSKWLEVFHMNTTTSRKTIETLRTLFASYGLPEDVVSDNGPQFISYEFKDFLSKNGVRQILTPPYHPASNGAAERSVQTVKQGLLKQVMEGRTNQTLQHRLDNILLTYRITPHTVTGCTPSELFLKRQIRNRFTLLKPNLEQTVTHKQELQAKDHDSRVRVRSFEVGQFVQVKNFRGDINRWIPGRITKKLGLQTFLVRTGGKIRYCHIDHLLPGNDNDIVDSNTNSPTDIEIDITSSKPLVGPPEKRPNLLLPNISNNAGTSSTTGTHAASIGTPTSPVKSFDTNQRYPQRVRKPPEKLTL